MRIFSKFFGRRRKKTLKDGTIGFPIRNGEQQQKIATALKNAVEIAPIIKEDGRYYSIEISFEKMVKTTQDDLKAQQVILAILTGDYDHSFNGSSKYNKNPVNIKIIENKAYFYDMEGNPKNNIDKKDLKYLQQQTSNIKKKILKRIKNINKKNITPEISNNLKIIESNILDEKESKH